MSFIHDIKFDNIHSKVRSLLVENDCAVRDENGFLYIPTKFCGEFIREESESKNVAEILNGATDLIPNQYEGGFKVWEGLLDLVQFFKKNPEFLEKFSQRENLNILDVGCGSGLLGIFVGQTLREFRADIKATVFLQDFNRSVIETFTLPNVILNESFDFHGSDAFKREDVEDSYRFLYGDWLNITELLDSNQTKFDIILSTETLYSEDNYGKLSQLFSRLLKDDGRILIGTKSHYFGVGGGTYSFMDHIEAKHPELTVDALHEIEHESLLRHILILKRK